MQTLAFEIAHGKHTLRISHFSKDSLVSSVKQYLCEPQQSQTLNLEQNSTPEHIKLIYKKTWLDQDSIGQYLSESEKSDHVPRVMLLWTRAAPLPKPSSVVLRVRQTTNNDTPLYQGFLQVRTLREFKDHQVAEELLMKLSSDVGVCTVMQQYGWKVGVLSELSPGERSILGFNRNKGEEISIRLRTDDLSGFRAYDMILHVLLHELSHIVHSEHDANFHALHRTLKKLVEKYNRTHTISDGEYAPEREDSTFLEFEQLVLPTGPQSLGGGRSNANETVEQRRARLAAAAELRLTAQEKELNEHCGTK